MTETHASNQRKDPQLIRVSLLFAQILIPFGLYWAMNRDSSLGMGICAALFFLSMGVLVCLS